MNLSAFKAYDIRGKLGEEINEELAYKVGLAYANVFNPRSVAVGGDVRLTSEPLKKAIANGLADGGVNVFDLGMTGTEEVYFAAFALNDELDGGIEVTASHNPIDYNGFKLVGKSAVPIGQDTGLDEIKNRISENHLVKAQNRGAVQTINILNQYVEHLLSYINPVKLKPLKLVVNAGNGAAGHVVDAIEDYFSKKNIPVEFIKIHNQPDPTFPNGIPNPMLLENQDVTRQAVLNHQADMGIAWDGDFDRCFLFDETGRFIEGYYIVGLLAQAFLEKQKGEKVIYDPRLIWNTIDIVEQAGGVPIQSRSGHSFIKAAMREHNAIYGGEMSAHHYFRDFGYCDSGMIPWLLVTDLLSHSEQPLSKLLDDRIYKYPCSGEINFKVKDAPATIQKIQTKYADLGPVVDKTDGISLNFGDWRLNVRSSNTEPLLRLNIESRANPELVNQKLVELTDLISSDA